MGFFWQNASARPMMMQLTTISGMNTPSASLSAGMIRLEQQVN